MFDLYSPEADTVLEIPQTAAEYVAEFFSDKTVIKLPLCANNSLIEDEFSLLKTPHYGLFLENTLECIGNAVKAGYEPHTLDDIVAMVEAAEIAVTAAGHTLQTPTCSWKCGHYVELRLTEGVEIAPGDIVYPTLNIHTGFNGKSHLGFAGLYRFLCSNGMVTPVLGALNYQFKVPHTKGLREKMPMLIEHFGKSAESFSAVLAGARLLTEIEVNLLEMIAAIYPKPETKVAETLFCNRSDEIVAIAEDECRQLRVSTDTTKTTAWLAFNAVQGYYRQKFEEKHGNHQANVKANNHPAVKAATDYVLNLQKKTV